MFIDVEKNQSRSKFKNWIKVISWNNLKNNTNFNYAGWAGYKELPEWNQDDNGLVEGPKK